MISVAAAVLVFSALLGVLVATATAAVVHTITFDDPLAFPAFQPLITSNLSAAASDWAQFLVGSAALEMVVKFDTGIPGATGRSVTSNFVASHGGHNIFEQGAAAEIRTGLDPNGGAFDIEIVLAPDYMQNELFFDPAPTLRVAPVPNTRTDAVSVFLHELGHAYSFNGFIDGTTGIFPTNLSTFDDLTVFDGTNYFFVGPQAETLYGGRVPLTFGNPFHLGNNSPRPGTDLISDLMNGIVFDRGFRYDISAIDFAITCDVGVPGTTCAGQVAVPEPATWLLLGSGFLATGVIAWGGRRLTPLTRGVTGVTTTFP